MRFLFIVSCIAGLLGCSGWSDDSMYLTGTEEYAVRTADGEYVCPTPKKVLICHIPPGNPENAHTICVSTHAVEPHQEHHGDLVGACDGDGDDGDVDGGVDVEVDGGDGDGDNGDVDATPPDVPID